MRKTKIALIAALAMASIASPVLAQTYIPQERSYRSGPLYNYTPGDRGYSNYYNDYDGSQGYGSNNCGISC